MDGPPPTPPPHGQKPKSANANLPPGKYDIFIIPPHSSGSGFLYLPSLRPNTNSFAAGFASALVLVVLFQSMAPAFKSWWSNFQGMGNMALVLLVIAVGVGSWALGRIQSDRASEPSTTAGGGSTDGGSGAGSHYASGSFPGSGTYADGSPGSHPPPPPPSGSPPQQPGPKSGAAHDEKPNSSWQHPPEAEQPVPEQAQAEEPRRATPHTEMPKNPWQKERNETQTKEEERKASEEELKVKEAEQKRKRDEERKAKEKELKVKEAEQRRKRDEERKAKEEELKTKEADLKRKQEVAKRLKELREREARDKARREQEAKEKAAREIQEKAERERLIREKLEREAREKEARDREKREREQKEAEVREKEAREKERLAKELQEKAAREKQIRETRLREARERDLRERLAKEKALREKLEKEAEERKAKEEKEKLEKEARLKAATGLREDSPRKSTYAFACVGEKVNPWPNGKPSSQTSSASPTKPRASPSTQRPPAPTARTYTGTVDEEAHASRASQQGRRKSGETHFTKSTYSYAESTSTSNTSPPLSTRGRYSTKDPNKIVIKGVYCFTNQFAKTPASQLLSGQGSVTDGLILRITTEGLFIDDDVRGVPQREWDVKAWTLKLMEVWCSSDGFAATSSAAPTSKPQMWRSRADRGQPKTLVGEDADTFLVNMLRTCKDDCRLSPHGDGAGSLHVLRATIRDQESKRYLFILREEEGWKVALALQRLRKGTQVRQLGIQPMSALELQNTLELLGWI